MDKYGLAKLIEWAGHEGVQGRKRLQKVVYFLQRAGCPFEAEYILHHYGPYSRDVAEACDALTAASFVEETSATKNGNTQYRYTMTPSGLEAIGRAEGQIGDKAKTFQQFESRAKDLIVKPIPELELGSTILYCRGRASSWEDAVDEACRFKGINPSSDGELVDSAHKLAKEFWGQA